MTIAFQAFGQRSNSKPHNDDALLLNGQVYQGSIREQGEVDHTAKAVYFAVEKSVSNSPCPHTANRRLLELLQARLNAADVRRCQTLTSLSHR